MVNTNRLGLADQALLDKIDKLRELNVQDLELPQLIVVGDQSSGKSSVLESLTGFAFPQGARLCTRYATQISCRRRPEQSVSVSIIPRPNADPELIERLRAFHAEGDKISATVLETYFSEANRCMGIKMFSDDDDDSQPQAFSEDILKIEINGPEQEHFTVIDVPGIFRVPNPPLTTDSDVTFVRNMVESYMRNSKTIILAVLPSNVDISTQEILKMAEIADPEGVGTMGVLTKPDLVLENATRDTIKQLVLGERNKLCLGYCMVKNRGADDRSSTLIERLEQEKKFFSMLEWRSLLTTGRCGVGSLKTHLGDLLTDITNKELPIVRSDVLKQLSAFRGQLERLGPARTDEISQRLYLGNLSTTFQAITQDALNGSYDGNPVFTAQPSLKLITAVTKMNEAFSNEFWEKGHKRQTSAHGVKDEEQAYDLGKKDKDTTLSQITLRDYPELCDIVEMEDYECPKPIASDEDPIADHIQRVYQENRGPELGTFSGAILAMIFKEQSEKWPLLVQAHVSQSIILVHDYIAKLLAHVCPDKQICDQLWDHLIMDAVRKAYVRAMSQAHFLLRIEREGKPSTYNHYFNSEVQKKRLDRLDAVIAEKFPQKEGAEPQLIATTSLRSLVTDKDNMQQVREDIPDVLCSYYKVSRKRFVDVICRQAIGHFLLEGEESPLRVFSPELVFGLGAEQLELIAGEDAGTRERRAMLEAEIKGLEAAMKLLRI